MDITEAQAIIQDHNNISLEINTANIFNNVKGMSMASVCYVGEVKTAAGSALKGKIKKVTKASISLANNLREYTNVYINKVQRTSDKPDQEWVPSATWNHFTDVACVKKHNTADSFYLFSLYNGADTIYVTEDEDGVLIEMSKEEVIAELTPSAAKALMADNSTVYNKTNDVTHQAIVRTLGLGSIASLTVQGNTYVGEFVYKD